MAKQEELIFVLNPMLRGWANYHRHQVSSIAFARMDALIWRALWKWCKRRHHNKGIRWIKEKYFCSTATRNWIFGTTYTDPKGELKPIELFYCGYVKIERHIKVKQDYNPFLPEWELYGEELHRQRLYNKQSHRRQWQALYNDQKGKCALCEQAITEETGWHDHHIEYRMYGGSDALSNRCLLHPICHRKVHALNLKVVKPTIT
ncbi:group II intron maturase-specific domain-containing protein [Testudinibacter sp. P80/BLE/0925]|uniref:group II intron maturase-specific domain-containing protein n=1 Tax=Testudinibacter sp. TW-1 TaxID=3417757 RepID=UPI003D36DDD6